MTDDKLIRMDMGTLAGDKHNGQDSRAILC